MGGYIRMDKDLEDDPRVDELGEHLADLLGISKPLACDAVIGGLYKLWRHGDTHLGRHNRIKGASRGLARIAEVTALPVSLLERFPVEWLRVHTDGSIELPDYASKNALIDRDIRRAHGRDRTARWREKKRRESNGGDTSHSVTSASSQRHQGVTTGTGTGTGTGTETTETGTGTPTEHASLAAAVDAAAPRKPPEQDFRDDFRARHGVDPLPTAPAIPRALRAHNGASKSPEQLEHDIDRLADTGMPPDAIAHALGQYGVTASQVTSRLSSRPVHEGKSTEGPQ